jgi:hypothetical protein
MHVAVAAFGGRRDRHAAANVTPEQFEHPCGDPAT